MKKKKLIIAGSALLVLVIAAVTVYFSMTTKAERKFGTHKAQSSTMEVIGGLVYNVRSDRIIDIPDEYILSLNKEAHTFDEIKEILGEPSGYYGSGIVRAYWRIGERRYAVCAFLGDVQPITIKEY